MAVSTENAAAEIQGWLKENVTGGREVSPEEPLIENGVLTSLQTVSSSRSSREGSTSSSRTRSLTRRTSAPSSHRLSGGEQDRVSMPHPEFTLHDLLANAVERDPGRVAIVDGKAEYTYEDLERASNSLGAALVESGVKKGDRVGVYLEKSWEAIVAMLAASRNRRSLREHKPALQAAAGRVPDTGLRRARHDRGLR